MTYRNVPSGDSASKVKRPGNVIRRGAVRPSVAMTVNRVAGEPVDLSSSSTSVRASPDRPPGIRARPIAGSCHAPATEISRWTAPPFGSIARTTVDVPDGPVANRTCQSAAGTPAGSLNSTVPVPPSTTA